MELTDTRTTWLIETAKALKGADRRRFLARTVKELGRGGQRLAERTLGWNRQTIRKGLCELDRGVTCLDAFALRRRKRAEEHLPTLLDDVRAIVDGQSQTDPDFRSARLYTRLTAKEVRHQLIVQKGYSDAELPTTRTISTKLRALGYYPSKVAKTQPQKKSPKPMPSSSKSPQ
ncbi:MAG: hypothetical protein M3N47_06705 [Chloroflexota bacterium]|nr:hypothetical protein [Chloroflexota bacterium]